VEPRLYTGCRTTESYLGSQFQPTCLFSVLVILIACHHCLKTRQWFRSAESSFSPSDKSIVSSYSSDFTDQNHMSRNVPRSSHSMGSAKIFRRRCAKWHCWTGRFDMSHFCRRIRSRRCRSKPISVRLVWIFFWNAIDVSMNGDVQKRQLRMMGTLLANLGHAHREVLAILNVGQLASSVLVTNDHCPNVRQHHSCFVLFRVVKVHTSGGVEA